MPSLFISYYSVGALGGFTIGTGDGGGKGVMGPSTTQITFQKVDLYIDDSNFVWSSIGYYLSKSNLYQVSSYSSSYLMMGYHYISAGYGGGGVVPKTTQFPSQKFPP